MGIGFGVKGHLVGWRMMKVTVVTSMSQKGYETYGKRFIRSFRKHWKYVNATLVIYSEDRLPVRHRHLDKDKELVQFLKEAENHPSPHPGDYRWEAGRFAHKVFALTDPRNQKDCDWLIWLDADTETFKPVTWEFLETLLPQEADVVYLGRKDMPHSECGFMAFKRQKAKAFLRHLRNQYTEGVIWNEAEWHDSYLFDRIREGGIWRFHDLSAGIPGMHVWDDCPIGEVMRHHKGPLRQKGLTPGKARVPDGYWSQKEIRQAGQVEGGGHLRIQTKNCVPDDQIQSNIKANVGRIQSWLRECNPDPTKRAIICSAGPSLENYLDRIRQYQAEGDYIVCVKHAHDLLISKGIVPDVCVLLDPRDHVQDFIENPHPDVTYFVASMVHPTTLDRLLERGSKILGYNALVGAGEDKVLQAGHILVGGGSTSATRAVNVLNALGFRRYHMYGFDSCYPDKAPSKETEANGLPKYFEVKTGGRTFVTDAELLAQSQDFDQMLDMGKEIFLEMEVFGPGMIPHVFACRRRILPDMEEVLGGIRTSAAA